MVDMMYDRQKTLKLTVPTTATVVGCGGIGAWVAIDLALSGVKKLQLFDYDKLEYSNLNRLPFKPSDVGKDKNAVLSDFIKERRPDIELVCFGKVSEMTKDLIAGNAVIDCTDKLAAQKLVYDSCMKKGLAYFRVGYDGNHITILDGRHKDAPVPKKVWSDGSGRDGYTIVSSWAAPPQFAAALVTYMVCNKGRQIFAPIIGDIGEMLNGMGKRSGNNKG